MARQHDLANPAGSGAASYEGAAAEARRPFDEHPADQEALFRELIRYATLAPSSYNSQPWKFWIERNAIVITPDLERRCPVVDPNGHHLFVSLGAATENLVLAARADGQRASVRFDPAGEGSVRVDLTQAAPAVSSLYAAITARQCTRSLYDGRTVTLSDLEQLNEAAARFDGMQIDFLTAPRQIEHVIEYVVAANTKQLENPAFTKELRHWLRFDDHESLATRDGLSSRASGSPSVPRWLGNAMLDLMLSPKAAGEHYAAAIRSSAGIAVFSSAANDKEHWIQAGRCFEQFSLTASALDIRVAVLNQPLEFPAGRAMFAHELGLGTRRPDLIVRFGYAPELPPSLRRPVAAVIA